MFRGRLSWRKLRDLLRHLPRGCATDIAINGEIAEWGYMEELLAGVLDVLQAANYQRGGGKGRKPEPVARPTSNKPIVQATTKEKIVAELKLREQGQLTREEFEKHMFGD